MNRGIISKIFDWTKHPTFDTESDPKAYLAFVAVALIVAFLWSRVIKQLVDN